MNVTIFVKKNFVSQWRNLQYAETKLGFNYGSQRTFFVKNCLSDSAENLVGENLQYHEKIGL